MIEGEIQMQVIYLNDMYEAEEKVLKEHGISTVRIDCSHLPVPMRIENGAIFRGPKMNAVQYRDFVRRLEPVVPFVTPEQFEIAADAVSYSERLGSYSPKTLSFEIDTPVDRIEAELKGVHLPLFVRSNVESAAKYVGVEACMLRELDQLHTVLLPIHKYIKTAEKIIFKEVVPLKVIAGKTVEYRAIVINNKLVCFDYNPDCGLPDPYDLQWEPIIETAFHNGMKGAYFLDLGVETSGRIFVVECKNLFNGTIKNTERFADGLKTIC